MERVTDEQLRAYAADGAVLLPGLFTDWVEPLRAGIEKNLAAPGPDVRQYVGAGGTGLFFGDYCNWARIPEYRAFMFDSPAAAVAARLMGSESVRLFHEHVLIKESDAMQPTPWHQDQPYYCVDGNQVCSLWLALDEVSRDTSVEYLAGSHKWGRWFRPERFNGEALNDGRGWEQTPDVESRRDEFTILGWDLAPGDAIAFHFMTLHGAPPNRHARRRRAFTSRWMGDDARFADRAGTTSPPFPGLSLRHGDPMDAPEFPLILPRHTA